MSPESPPLAAYVETFAAEWRRAEDAAAKEVARRNVIAGVLVLAEQVSLGEIAVDEGSVAAAGLRSRRLHPELWRARQRLVFANLQAAPRDALPSPEELLASLAAADGRFRHDLSVFVP
jgi:hypothetical protein